MTNEHLLSHPEVGKIEFEVFGISQVKRTCSSRFQVHCDVVALHNNEILLLSVLGPEMSVKALTAGLRFSARDQKRVAYSVQLDGLNERHLTKCLDGYRVYRTKLAYGLWHVLFLAKRPGFMPVITEQNLWQHLQTDQFTTPLVREWMPWLCQELRQQGHIVELEQKGCQAGLLLLDNDRLDALISTGLRNRHISIIDHSRKTYQRDGECHRPIVTLDEYLTAYGSLLGQHAQHSLQPLHIPGEHNVTDLNLLREPFPAQAHVIEALRKTLRRQKSVLVVGEMGVGKTLVGMSAIHAHAAGRAYRALVFCPGQLTQKWAREIRETIPDAEIKQIENWRNLLSLNRRTKPKTIQWFIIARDRAKLGARWRPACLTAGQRRDGFLRCPQCGRRLVDDKRDPIRIGQPAKAGQPGSGLWKRRSRCELVLSVQSGKADEADQLVEGCGSPLWQMTNELQRYEPALYIKRRLRRFFKYCCLDEVHEEKGAETAQGHAAAALASSCQKVIALTGTLIGGYADHVRPLLFRLSPGSLINEGIRWSEPLSFNEKYGRIETRIIERTRGRDSDNRMSRGSKSTIKSLRPGIMPPLFGRHLIDKCVFLGLNEVTDNLPPLTEECLPVPMDSKLADAYRNEVEEPLVDAIKEMMKRRDRRLLGAMLQTLLAYPDFPFDWNPISYLKGDAWVTVASPPTLNADELRPKELALIDLVRSEKSARRQVWVYVQYTDRHDVQGRLKKLLVQHGFRVSVLRSSVPLNRREEWIKKHAPFLDVVISHPRLVETGLDLFDKGGRHNFPTIVFYETGYNLFTLRQASRRSWRIGQTKTCRVIYLYYERTMQERALTLMGRKMTAAQALEGKFSSEGLVAMAGEDASVEIALAKNLVERLENGVMDRPWGTVRPKIATKRVVPFPESEASALLSLSGMTQKHLFDGLDREIGSPPFAATSR